MMEDGTARPVVGWTANVDRTEGEVMKCSMRIEGSSTKSVAQRVPETLWYSVRPIIAAEEQHQQ